MRGLLQDTALGWLYDVDNNVQISVDQNLHLRSAHSIESNHIRLVSPLLFAYRKQRIEGIKTWFLGHLKI
jgi:hypothetical protein